MKKTLLILAAVVGVALLAIVIANLWPESDLVEHRVEPLYAVDDPQFLRAVGTLLGPSLTEGNSVVELTNGDEVFPAMLEAIRSAKQSITFETYIYWEGAIGRAFAAALSERARAGVPVHIILDWAGSQKMDEESLDTLRAAGADVVMYRRPKWHNVGELNERTHRKLLVVDGRIGFTGGFGIADKWLGDAKTPDHWRDSQFRVEGPVVAQMQAAFMDNWLRVRADLLHGEAYFPPLFRRGQHQAQMFVSSPDEGNGRMRLLYLLSIASARESVRIATSYFVPDKLTTEALVSARRRGVDVEIIVPGPHIDMEIVRRASRALWGPLLAAGVRLYEYQPTMYHAKFMVVDGVWVTVGSTNIDYRSFQYNDEANLNVHDQNFAGEVERVFTSDRSKSRRVTLAGWQNRPWTEKIKERLAALLRWQL